MPSRRAKGAFLGLAVGDALGAPVEFLPRGAFPPVTDMMAGGHFRLPAGAWTDDTAMALCLAQSLAEHPNLDAADLVTHFLRWLDHGENTSTGRSIGAGQNTLRVLRHLSRTGELQAPPGGKRTDGNGALMRLAPVACMHWQNPQLAMEIAARQSRVTHHSDLSASACELAARLMCMLIQGTPWDEATQFPPQPHWPEDIKTLAAGSWKSKTEADISSSGYVVSTLEAALWAVDISQTFTEAVLRAVNLGDDADTVGAVTGQLAGARWGYNAIPQRWSCVLAKKEVLDVCFNSVFLFSKPESL